MAAEMEREGFELPLLIGGATTSRTHTAVKIEPQYHGPVVHVADASRAVGVAGALMDRDRREGFAAGVREEYETVRRERGARQEKIARHPIAEARRHRLAVDWTAVRAAAARPSSASGRSRTSRSASSSSGSTGRPFFATWELNGPYPAILVRPGRRRGRPRRSTRDALALLDRIVTSGCCRRGAWSASGRRTASATTSSSTPTSAGAAPPGRSTRSASRWSSRRAGRTSPWPTSPRRAIPGSSTTSARSR